MAAVGSLLVRIGADTGGLRRGGRRAESTIRRMERAAGRASAKIGKLGGVAAVAGGALTAELTRRGLKAVDAQAKLARTLDTTIGELRGLQLAASDSGVSAETLEQNLTALNRRLGQARQGTGQARRALDELGLSAERLGEMSLTERVAAISEAMDEAGPAINRTAIAADLMSRSGIKMLNMMEGGGEQIRAATKEIKDFGLAVSATDAAQVEAANDAISRIGLAIESISKNLAVEFAPLITAVAKKINNAAKSGGGFREEINDLLEAGVTGFGAIANAVFGVQKAMVQAQVAALNLRYTLNAKSQAIEKLEASTDRAVFSLGDLIRKLTGVGKTDAELERMRSALVHARQELEGMDKAEMPMDRMRRWVEEARRLSQEAAENVVADREKEKDESNRIADEMRFGRIASLEKARKAEAQARKRSLENLRSNLQSAREAEMERYNERRQLIQTSTDAELELVGGRNAALQKLEKQHQSRLKDIRGEGGGLSEAEKAQRKASLDNLQSYLQSEYQAHLMQRDRRIELINSMTEKEVELYGGRAKLLEEVNQAHQERLNQQVRRGAHKRQQFQEASMQAQATSVANNLVRMTASVAKENKAMFKLHKAASITMATINTYEGVSKAIAKYPPPLSFAMAAAQMTAGMLQVRKIASSSFGSKASGGSVGGGGAGSGGAGGGGGAAQTDTGPNTIIHLEGDSFGQQQIRDLVTQINEDSRDGGRIQVQ